MGFDLARGLYAAGGGDPAAFDALKQKAQEWRDNASQRAADLQASQLSNSLTGAYLKQMGVDTSGVTSAGGSSMQPPSMLPQAPQGPQVPPSAMMSMATGGYGDAGGNMLPQAPQLPQANPTSQFGANMPPVGLSMDNGKMSIKPMTPYQQQMLQMRQDSMDQRTQNQWTTFLHQNNPELASPRSTLGMAGTGNAKADRALATLQNNPLVTSADLGNITADLASIYQGGAPTDMGMKHQEYGTIWTNIQKLKQFVTNNPTDVLPQAMKDKVIDTITRLKDANNKVLNNYFDTTEKSQTKLISKNPDEWKAFRGGFDPLFGQQAANDTFTENAKSHGYTDAQIQSYLKAKNGK